MTTSPTRSKTRSRPTSRAGGGFLGIGSAVELEPGWQFLTDVLGSRAAAVSEANPTNPLAAQTVTNKVADRVHDASKNLPEYWNLTDTYYNWTSNVRGLSHVLTTVSDAPFNKTGDGPTINALTGGTMGADHPVTWCKDYKGGRSYYTNHGATDAAWSNANLVKELVGAIAWASGAVRPGLQRLRRDRARELRADQDQRPAEPARADRVRPVPGRADHPDRAHRHRTPARPDDRHDRGSRQLRRPERAR